MSGCATTFGIGSNLFGRCEFKFDGCSLIKDDIDGWVPKVCDASEIIEEKM